MPMKLLSTDDFRAEVKDGRTPDATVFRFATTDAETVGDASARTKRFVFSDATVDHAKDSIDQKGWDLSVFKRNPVALFSHMSWEPPIGRASNVGVQNDKLKGDIEFATAEVYEFADTIYRLVHGEFMKAVSVGFQPKEWAFSTDKDRPYGIDFKKQLLLEISVCPVPCNPNALTEARSAGIDTRSLVEWAEKVLDNGDVVFLPRKDVELLRVQAKDAPPPRYYIQADNHLTAPAAERVRDAVKAWQADPQQVLILDGGLTLRTLGEPHSPAAPEGGVNDKDLQSALLKIDSTALRTQIEVALKAGRRVSAATKAKLQEALDHHDAAAKCIKDVMCADDDMDDADDDAGADDDGDLDDDGGTPDPSDLGPDDLTLMTPEELRLKEAKALKASLPAID
jgi:HK97 family phage prohead protease